MFGGEDNKAERQVWRCDLRQERVIFGARSYATIALQAQPNQAGLSSSAVLGLVTKCFGDCNRLDARLSGYQVAVGPVDNDAMPGNVDDPWDLLHGGFSYGS